MRGMSALSALLDRPAPSFEGPDPAVLRLMEAVRRVAVETLAATGDDDTSHAARRAIADGRDVLRVGIAPADVDATPGASSVIALVRIDGDDGDRKLLFRFDGDGRIHSATPVKTHAQEGRAR